MPKDVQRLELYYDAEEENARADPETLRERLAAVAEERGLDHRVTDIADVPEAEWAGRYESLSERAGAEEYHVGNRLFTPQTFGSLRPALVIQYEDSDAVDIYPHHNDAVGDRPVTIDDFLDELDPEATSERGDYAWLREQRRQAETEPEEESPDEQERDGEGFVSTIKGLVS
jgi:hypothetical protein